MRRSSRTSTSLSAAVSAPLAAALVTFALGGCGSTAEQVPATTSPSTSSESASASSSAPEQTSTTSQSSEAQLPPDVDPAILEGQRQVSIQVAETSAGLEFIAGELGLLAEGSTESSRVVLAESAPRSGEFLIRLLDGEVDDGCWSVTASATVEVQPCDASVPEQLFTLASGGSEGTVVIGSAGASLVAGEDGVAFADGEGTALSVVDRGEYEDPFDE